MVWISRTDRGPASHSTRRMVSSNFVGRTSLVAMGGIIDEVIRHCQRNYSSSWPSMSRTIQAIGEASQAYLQQLEDRLSSLPSDLAQGISPEAIARTITESLRQQFVQSGLPATADALTALSQQVTHATGQLQRAAGQLSACTGIAAQAQEAIDRMTTSVANATDTAQWALATLRHEFR